MNRKAVITGATKGIGRAIAEALATEGYDLAICSRHQADLDALKADFTERFPTIKLIAHAVDVSQKAEVLAFAAAITDAWKRVDVLVNNAGIILFGTIRDDAEDTLDTMINVNLMSAYHLTRALLPVMLARKRGYIFTICSTASLRPYVNCGSYSISKFALLGFSRNLREELKETGIKVTSILPGSTWSDSWAGFDAPESRLMQARDIAEVVMSALRMSPSAVIEEVLMRPQLGDV